MGMAGFQFFSSDLQEWRVPHGDKLVVRGCLAGKAGSRMVSPGSGGSLR